ncbi:MAG: ABC transporter ATP-binding protein [Nitrospinae bacterium]|nr:ABC transporter ATP-binding protein [Nitrospinota bacterium]
MAGDTLLKVEGIASGYGKKQILHGVSLEVSRGETIALIGPNGAGKSTVLLTILGYLKPTEGKVVLEGEDITGIEPHLIIQHGVAYCPQGRNIFPQMTVSEHLNLGAWTVGDAEERRRAREGVFGLFPILKEKESSKARTLSGGQRQMLSFGMAMVTRPTLILLDEPTIGLAPTVMDTIFESIERIHRDGVSILVVEQNSAKALENSDRGYVLDMGRNRREGDSAELLLDPNIRQMYLGM